MKSGQNCGGMNLLYFHDDTMVVCPDDQEVMELPDSRKGGVLGSQDLPPSTFDIDGESNSCLLAYLLEVGYAKYV